MHVRQTIIKHSESQTISIVWTYRGTNRPVGPRRSGRGMRLVAVLGWFLALVAHPALVAQASAAASPNLRSLEAQLSSLVASTPGDVGVAALDLKSGEIVSINGSEPFPMASTVKIAIAANYLAQVEHGRRTLNDTIRGPSATKLLEDMTTRSDNP